MPQVFTREGKINKKAIPFGTALIICSAQKIVGGHAEIIADFQDKICAQIDLFPFIAADRLLIGIENLRQLLLR